jgi:nucleoside-diphosphate-sugar epimerase
MKGRKVFLTGGCGYVGEAAISYLIQPYHPSEVLVIDKLLYQDSYLRPGVDFRLLDINTEGFWKVLDQEIDDIGAIIHLAAIVGDGACQALPELTVQTNEVFVRKLVSYLEERKPDVRLIFASTASVYGEAANIVTECSPTRPLSLYAGTKLAAEDAIVTSSLTNWVIFRLGTLFGLSASYGRIRADLVVNILTFKACQGEPMTIFGGEQWRPLMHVMDVGAIICKAVFETFKGTYLLSHDNFTIRQIADIIAKEVPGSSVNYAESKFEDLRNYRVDNSKSHMVHLYAKTTLEEGVRKMRDALLSGRIKNPWIPRYHNAQMAKEIALGN